MRACLESKLGGELSAVLELSLSQRTVGEEHRFVGDGFLVPCQFPTNVSVGDQADLGVGATPQGLNDLINDFQMLVAEKLTGRLPE